MHTIKEPLKLIDTEYGYKVNKPNQETQELVSKDWIEANLADIANNIYEPDKIHIIIEHLVGMDITMLKEKWIK